MNSFPSHAYDIIALDPSLRKEQLERITYSGVTRQRKVDEIRGLHKPRFLNLKRLSSEE